MDEKKIPKKRGRPKKVKCSDDSSPGVLCEKQSPPEENSDGDSFISYSSQNPLQEMETVEDAGETDLPQPQIAQRHYPSVTPPASSSSDDHIVSSIPLPPPSHRLWNWLSRKKQ